MATQPTSRDWLYVAGAFASLVALYFVLRPGTGPITQGDGTTTDIDQSAAVPSDGPGYTNYNYPPPATQNLQSVPVNTPPATYAPITDPDMSALPQSAYVPLPSGADTAPDQSAGCCCQTACNMASPLATGDGVSPDLNALLTYYQNTNPIYVELQQAQMQRYAAYFATGEAYSTGGVPLGVSPYGQ